MKKYLGPSIVMALGIGCIVYCIVNAKQPEPTEVVIKECQYEGGECPDPVCSGRLKYVTHITHVCKWVNCPYQQITCAIGEWNEAVFEVGECEKGTDCYYLDMLHWQFPAETYDQLLERLFAIQDQSGNDASVFWDNLETAYLNTNL